ncbi:hypothetical protein LTR84_010780 [Exophiala bonariae]|uniref:Uncharacterized protein n=1 Tax=Exophiala bonariae TaxID=1690606 RepID=A0AAV9NHD1_9EURO|nr:hypothetical protein LTR84_010780 [Exophiala bonariae]
MLPCDKEGQLYLVSEGRSNQHEREQWLQRRNSISSQRAIFPYKVDSHPFEHRPRYAMYNHAPSSRYSSTLRSVSEGACLDLSSDRSSSLNSTQSSGSFARSGRTSTTFHSTRTRATSNPERPVTARPDKGSSGKDAIPDVPPLPAAPAPTWSPALNHTPLSADPSIRAWTSESEGGQRSSVLYSRSSPPFIFQLPPRSRSMEPKIRKRSQDSTSETPAKQKTRTVTQATTAPTLMTTSSPPNTSPPGPPPTSNLPVLPTAPTVASIPPAIPLRAPGHSISRATTSHDPATPSAASSLRPALRRPSPLRYRQHPSSHSYQHHPQHYHYTPQQHYQKYQSELVLQAGMGTTQLSAPHSRTYRRQDHRRGRDPISSSIYSTSSCGTSRTMASTAASTLAVAR